MKLIIFLFIKMKEICSLYEMLNSPVFSIYSPIFVIYSQMFVTVRFEFKIKKSAFLMHA